MSEINAAEAAVLGLLSKALFGEEFKDIDTDWDLVLEESKNQAVSALVGSCVPASAGNYAKWQQITAQTMARNIRLQVAHCELHNLLTENNIPYVILKGCASASYYPKPVYRSMGDVDFLVYPKDVERAEALLIQNGYVEISKKSDHHYEFKKNSVVYELHYGVNGIPEGKMGPVVEKYLEDIIPTAKEVVLGNGKAMFPDDFHHGLVILLHTAKHMTNMGLGLRHLSDWATFVNHIEDFPAVFEDTLRKIGLWTFACQITSVCMKYLKLSPQSWGGEISDSFQHEMMLDILGSGNFGRKEGENRDRWLISYSTEMEQKDSSMAYHLFHRINKAAKQNWPVVQKVPVLLPFAWGFICFRYLFRILIGKRNKVHIGKLVKKAEKRKKLYNQFHLFE